MRVFARKPLAALGCALALCLTAIATAEPDYAAGDPQSCLGCHGEGGVLPAAGILHTVHGRAADPEGHLCQSCHGPSANHFRRDADGKQLSPAITFDDSTPAAQQNAVCLECHQEPQLIHWPGSAHQMDGLSCASCHRLHSTEDPVLDKRSEAAVCFNCHQGLRASIHKSSSHPIAEGLMSCSNCHAVHGSTTDFLLTAPSTIETCYQCHAEKRGPFLWEHQPVREDCGNCHDPHGSLHSSLLTSPQPWLCQQCHQAAFHPSSVASGSDIPPLGASTNVLSRSCLNCHNQVHGSNHPSGARLTR